MAKLNHVFSKWLFRSFTKIVEEEIKIGFRIIGFIMFMLHCNILYACAGWFEVFISLGLDLGTKIEPDRSTWT